MGARVSLSIGILVVLRASDRRIIIRHTIPNISGLAITSMTIAIPKGCVEGGEITFQGNDLLKYSKKQMQSIRGDDISMIFQDPITRLNPTMTVGRQIAEVLVKHQRLSKKEALKKAEEYLRLVGIANPEKRIKEYPNSLSGGMSQRVMIAIAIAMCCNPKLLIAEEPTTALDVTTQAQILELMQELQRKFNTSIILIVVANMAERVLVFYAGKVVENGPTRSVFYQPRHPYTRGLLKSMPKLNAGAGRSWSAYRARRPRGAPLRRGANMR